MSYHLFRKHTIVLCDNIMCNELIKMSSHIQARAGVSSSVDVLKLAEAFINESNYTVWSDLSVNLGGVSLLVQYTDYHENFKAFLRHVFAAVAKKMGWESKTGESEFSTCLINCLLSNSPFKLHRILG